MALRARARRADRAAAPVQQHSRRTIAGPRTARTTEQPFVLIPKTARPAVRGVPTARVPARPLPSFRLSYLKLTIVFLAVLDGLVLISDISTTQPINYYVSIVWSLYLPIALIGLAGGVAARRVQPAQFSGRVHQRVIFLVPTVARFDTLPALQRVVGSILEHAPRNLTNFRVDILTDEGAAGITTIQEIYATEARVRLTVVPRTFATPNGTIHKARANEYARVLRDAAGENTDDIFVYHLDDDTAVGADTVASIAEFIDKDDGRYHLAQGVLAFPHELSPSLVCRLADSIRPIDDLTRFYFFTGALHRPLAGLHGEHLLVRASIESAIGWDFGPVKVEDAYFALKFSTRYPGTSTFLRSCTYGASPASVRDLITQRRRWAAGLIAMAFDRRLGLGHRLPLAYAVSQWFCAIFQYAGVVLLIAVLAGTPGTHPVTWALLPVWAFNFAYIVWSFLEGLKINLGVSRERRSYLGQALRLVGLFYVISAVEAWAAYLGLLDFLTKRQGFAVISKQH